MHVIEVSSRPGFHVLATTPKAQAATMVLGPGEGTGGPDNRHPDSDQWVYVIAGEGRAVVEGAQRALGPGDLLVIEAGEGHEIRNAGSAPLETLSFYATPVY